MSVQDILEQLENPVSTYPGRDNAPIERIDCAEDIIAAYDTFISLLYTHSSRDMSWDVMQRTHYIFDQWVVFHNTWKLALNYAKIKMLESMRD